jgi:hypothetical protein
MKVTLLVWFLLSTADLLYALPIPNQQQNRKGAISIPWRKIIPPLGAVGLLGGLAGLVYLGTKADEAYAALKTLDESEFQAKYQSLDPREQAYLDNRKQFIGITLSPEQKESLKDMDERFGWPTMKMPDTHKISEEDKRLLQGVYGRLRHALEKVDRTHETTTKAILNAEIAKAEQREAQMQAAVIAATDWKQALNQVQGEI